MYCTACGNEVPTNAKKCPVCGQRVENNGPYAVSVVFVEGNQILAETTISMGQDATVTFGRRADNQIVVAPPSGTVSGYHGMFEVRDGKLYVVDNDSTNGLYYNGSKQSRIPLVSGDIVTVGIPRVGERRTIMIVGEVGRSWGVVDLADRAALSIGRVSGNELVLDDPTVSAYHANLIRDGSDTWSITDLGSSNGTRVNGSYIQGTMPLVAGSLVMLGNTRMVFSDVCLLLMKERQGVEVVAESLVRRRGKGGDAFITTDHISLRIKRGEFVAIVGGSGCGKSTLLNELNGTEPADEGTVTVDGTDLYANYGMLKSSIGYVPQQDIVYEGLRLRDMLLYAAKLRMQPDTTKSEREDRVDRVLRNLELDNRANNLIEKLSGGQKKRASIAVELLADPRLLFLDEPTSGLDPGTERDLMQQLADMAHEGRTIILVTHTTLNLQLCDKVVFLGAGGKLCYAGDPGRLPAFFGVDDFVDVYNLIDGDGEPAKWERKWKQESSDDRMVGVTGGAGDSRQSKEAQRHRVPGFMSQFATLSSRYIRLIAGDRSRLALLLLQAPLLAALISLVAGADCFAVFEDTKSCLFALSCAAFWVGILDAIQEICKERTIFVRECGGGLRLGSYVASKVVVLGAICLLQSLLLIVTFMLITSVPASSLISAPVEMFLSTFCVMGSAMCLGLFVSSLFKNPDRAIAMAPLLIMPQILFSGLVFELEGMTEYISYAVNCRWAMEAYGTTANLNELDLAIYNEKIHIPEETKVLEDQTITVPEFDTKQEVEGLPEPVEVHVPEEKRHFDSIEVTIPEMDKEISSDMYEHETEDMYEFSLSHLIRSWGILLGFSLAAVLGCLVVLVLKSHR